MLSAVASLGRPRVAGAAAVAAAGSASVRRSLPAMSLATSATVFRNAPEEQQQQHHHRERSGQPRRPRLQKTVLVAALGGIAAGGLYAYLSNNDRQQKSMLMEGRPSAATTADEVKKAFILEGKPHLAFEPSRKVVARGSSGGSLQDQVKLTLFQYQTCPFCCKARAFLDYFGLDYNVVEVNSVTRKQLKWSEYKKVPILVADLPSGESIQLVDSSAIVSILFSYLFEASRDSSSPSADQSNVSLLDTASCYPRIKHLDPVDGKVKEDLTNKYFLMYKEIDISRDKEAIRQEREWRKWVDDVYVHTLSPNVYRTPSEALQAFNWFSQAGDWERHFAAWERALVVYVGSLAMWLIGKRLKARHRLKDDVRRSLYDETNVWLKAVRKGGGRFLGGDDSPNLADLAVFGVLSAVEGCDAFADLCENTKIKPWYDAVKEAVVNHQGRTLLLHHQPSL